MKALSPLLGLCLLLCAPWAWPQTGANEVLGEWWTPGFAARVRIEACGDALCGRIVWLWDEAAQQQALIGRRVVEGMRAAEGGRWAGGTLHDPEDGRSYKGSLQLQLPGSLKLEGCFGPFCRGQVWRRVEAARCPPVATR
jgi:Delta7-sterol 5-desaturase